MFSSRRVVVLKEVWRPGPDAGLKVALERRNALTPRLKDLDAGTRAQVHNTRRQALS